MKGAIAVVWAASTLARQSSLFCLSLAIKISGEGLASCCLSLIKVKASLTDCVMFEEDHGRWWGYHFHTFQFI